MKNIGFIGFGSMGSMLVRGLIESGKVSQDEIIITRKNKEKLKEIKKEWSEIKIAEDSLEVVKKAEIIFICVKPMEYKNILLEMKPAITKGHHIVSITAAVRIKDIERILDCKITKILPTVISEVKEGITLICHNNEVSKSDIETIENLLKDFTHLSNMDEESFGFASEFTSCGPGLYSAILQEFVEAGCRHSGNIPREELVKLVAQTVYGTARLMLLENMDFTEVINRVATKGGITEEGVKVFQSGLPAVFDEMFERTMGKRILVDQNVNNQYSDII